MPSSKSSNQSTQQQVVSQSTTVNVQNVIEQPKLEPLQKLKLLGEVLNTLDGPKEVAGAQTAVILSNPDPLAFFKDPQTLIWIGAGVIGLVLIAKRA
jgi:hypothetical protein